MLASGDLSCYFNNQTDMPAVRLRLPRGVTGPVTASCWVGDKHPVCAGTLPVPGHSPATWISTRHPGACTIKYRMRGKPERVDKVTVENGPKDVVIGAGAGN